MPSIFEIADRADRMAHARLLRRVGAAIAWACGPFRKSPAAPVVIRDRGYDDRAIVTAADIRRAWPHMREACGLVATSACRDELIRQAIRQAQARAAGIPVLPVARPNRAALIAREEDHADRC